MKSKTISADRADYSSARLSELQRELSQLQELKRAPKLTIFGAGSYARLEASKYSDIDMFFLSTATEEEDHEPQTNAHRIFGRVIELADRLRFPKFSNDCEYLEVLKVEDIRTNLGNRADDHRNYFTARMLMLLESKCLYGENIFQEVLKSIVASYFKDFPDHQDNFQPTFLLNDISRYWKTILLNYENKRGLPTTGPDADIKKTKHRVRNFKLKFSRMTTCYATVAAIGSRREPVTQQYVRNLVTLTPRQRLELVGRQLPKVGFHVEDVLKRYEWFLEMTGLPTRSLEAHFSDTERRTQMFGLANEYGDAMFRLIAAIDEVVPRSRLLRTLVI
jgi:predicted nucleotidyltransferase